jgi:hypothetical protein
LQPFLREFHKFLQLHRLNESLCDGNWWFAFLYYYLVVQDCPLKGKAKSDWMFDRVVLLDPDFTVSSEWLCMQWEFLLGEQQAGLWVVHHNRVSLGKMVSTQQPA